MEVCWVRRSFVEVSGLGLKGILRWTALWGKRFVRRVTWRGQTGSSIAGASREVQAHMASIGTSILPGSEEQ